ncbi:uncharacterized protein LOC130685051 isoform X2 [Manis pentadactyla]|uniref:uncharacterized protein LOC130685051 isoform X2 n=1 Tax=Manis pentadactyla TaxID=143292 RepID=UPI00255D038D|nr:uncharacterized protein LOC130685051 isoform X2 [Manis pentadactyla]
MELSETVVENGETEMSPEESREHKEEISEAEPVGGSLGGGRPPEEGAQEMMEEEEEIPKPKSVVAPPGAPKKEHVNVVFIGHVDAGKSTIGGQIMAGQPTSSTPWTAGLRDSGPPPTGLLLVFVLLSAQSRSMLSFFGSHIIVLTQFKNVTYPKPFHTHFQPLSLPANSSSNIIKLKGRNLTFFLNFILLHSIHCTNLVIFLLHTWLFSVSTNPLSLSIFYAY